jgi:threonine/homoserine/homoserine lactone efflux protein
MTDYWTTVTAGAMAGLGVAMPVGAIGVLLVQEAMRDRRGAMAGAAAVALVDMAYAALATALGPLVAAALSGVEAWVRLVSALILTAIAVHGLLASRRAGHPAPRADAAGPDRGAPPGGTAHAPARPVGGDRAAPGAGGGPGPGDAQAGARTRPRAHTVSDGVPGPVSAAPCSGTAAARSAAPCDGTAAAGSAAEPHGSAAASDEGTPSGGAAPSPSSEARSAAPGPQLAVGGPGGAGAHAREACGAGRGGSTRALARDGAKGGSRRGTAAASRGIAPGRVFARFAALTLVNPTTALYFAALTTAQGATLRGGAAGVVFVVGVLVASMAWQQVLVGVSGLAGARISDRARAWTFRAGYGLVAVYAVRVALPLP